MVRATIHVLFAVVISLCSFEAQSAQRFFVDEFEGEQLNAEHFNDLDGAFVVRNGEVRRTAYANDYTEDRHYVTTTLADYLDHDWTLEVTVRSPNEGPPDILYIGIGSGRPDETYFNEPGQSVLFRIHQGWIDGRVDVAAPTSGGEFNFFAESIGSLTGEAGEQFNRFTARITKIGNSIRFRICENPSQGTAPWTVCEREFSREIDDLAAVAPFLGNGNSFLFFGNGSASYSYERVALYEVSPGSESLPSRRPFQMLHPYEEWSPIGDNRPNFGAAIAIRGGTALVGMPTHLETVGAVAVYKRMGRGWQRVNDLPCPEQACEGVHSIAMRDNVAVVGTRRNVLVFREEQQEWRLKALIETPEPDLQLFPLPGSINYQDRIITAGAQSLEDGPGAVFVFEMTSAAQLARTSKLIASDGVPGDRFGTSVSMSIDGIIVGAPGATRTSSVSERGAAYVFRRTSGNWTQTQKLVAGDQARGFGEELAINNGVILIGAPQEDPVEETTSGYSASGAVYEFRKSGGAWRQSSKFRPSAIAYAHYRNFGRDIVMSGERAVITADSGADALTNDAVAVEYLIASTGLQARSIAEWASGGGVALFNNILALGGPFESAHPQIGHVELYNLALQPEDSDFCATQPTGPNFFCDDFEDGAAEEWEPIGATWTVERNVYTGRAGVESDQCNTGFSSNESLIRELRATDVDVTLEMHSIQRVDKGLVLRSTDPGNQIELNFLAAPYNVLAVQHSIDCVQEYLSFVPFEHQLGEIIKVRVRLVGQRLQVWVNGSSLVDAEFPVRTTAGSVGMVVITELGYSVFDNVHVEVLR